MKKGKVVLAQPAAAAAAPSRARPRPPLFSRAPAPVRGAGEEAAYRASLRFQALMQDYQELLKETEAKKRRINMEKLRKQRLLAEVKFLRKRFKSMSENPSQTIVCRVRNPAMSLRQQSSAWADATQQYSHHPMGSSSRNQLVHRRQDGPSRESRVIDLNEACEPGYEEMDMEDRHGYRAPLGIDRMRRYPMEGDVTAAGPSEVRTTAFWDAQNPVARAGKRKISWQDQLALRV